MKQGEKRLFLAVLAVLLAALALLAVQWVWGSDAPTVYRVSVLLDGAEGDYWRNFKAGLNQAALEFNVDLRFVSRYEAGDAQTDVLRREWEGDANGVVVIPQDGAALAEALTEAPAKLAVVVMGPKLDSQRVDGYVTPDYHRMGRQLAQAAKETGAARCTLYLSPGADAVAEEMIGGLSAALGELGLPWDRVDADPADLPAPAAEGVLLAVEPEMTEALCRQSAAAGRVCGVGASGRLLHELENGTAAALAVQSDYDAGYLSLARLVSVLSRKSGKGTVLESYTATRKNMFQEPMIDILFAAT